ncbi:hypothetical protein M430DRAFT_93507 [Amorphotheca resinae ATCC 22711]|uniref:Zn(2)-C6 fungal-type domain-containing protein n=1 Tax=Amorphotheca resinae ATCC 22711 TaxID=857342 RepID=A0A2T3BES7_AMORE|nr:hypothetical protein M430DRAFT_93507 [Amorphotheca resinae ATCC 22711]PSS27884.1 hypothetical protein M430DRAFT_93507 [Amorphotheca resinae ATCC 22711]
MSDPSPSFSTTGSDSGSASMGYQYATTSPGMDSSGNVMPSFQHFPRNHTQSGSPAPTQSTTSEAPSKPASSRSTSTPDVPGQETTDAAALALTAEKRRNKLGYHRTSVACGHCRRRKIRCIPAPADPQNRCSNCIRLKKACNFYPVDQQPQAENKRRSSRAPSGTGIASESSSPSTTSGQLPEVPPNLPFSHLNMPPIQDIGGPQMNRQRTESFSPPENEAVTTRNFEYGHGVTNWMAPDASPNTKSQADLPPQSYWRVNPQDSPLTPAFSPFTPVPAQTWPSTHPDASPRDELSWSAHQRSISYSNLEGLQGGQPQYVPFPNPPHAQPSSHSGTYTTKPRQMHTTDLYPPPNSSDHPQPHSTGALPQGQYPHWQQPYQYQKPETYAWSGPHGAPYQVPEQGQAAPLGYGYGDPAGAGYFPPPPAR